MSEHRVALGLGANLGDREGTILRAVEMIADLPATGALQLSPLFETLPVGPQDQPLFINAAATLLTHLSPGELLERLRGIEQQLGREQRGRWREREIDIDILLVDDAVIEQSDLRVPHPEMHRRRFVLEPLAAIAPEWRHPLLGLTVRELLERLDESTSLSTSPHHPPSDDSIH